MTAKLNAAEDITAGTNEIKISVKWPENIADLLKTNGTHKIRGEFYLDQDLKKRFSNLSDVKPTIDIIVNGTDAPPAPSPSPSPEEGLSVKVNDAPEETVKKVRALLEGSEEYGEYEVKDIYCLNKNNEKIQPDRLMEVSVKLKKKYKDIKVLHLNNEDKLEELTYDAFDGQTVVFKTKSFSPFVFAEVKKENKVPEKPDETSTSKTAETAETSTSKAPEKETDASTSAATVPKVSPSVSTEDLNTEDAPNITTSRAAASAARTGDRNNIFIYLMLIISAGIIFSITFFRKKDNK